MVYVELNMVRAGVVREPSEWPWCSYQDWMGIRKRYRVLDREGFLKLMGNARLEEFEDQYQRLITETIAKRQLARQPQWTESIAVGSEQFVQSIADTIHHRQNLRYEVTQGGSWCLREGPESTKILRESKERQKEPLSTKSRVESESIS